MKNYKKGLSRVRCGGSKGFTLIELLVVIAIIGILSGIVLTSLGTARNKAKDASAIGSLSSARAEAELGSDSSGTYVDDICTLTTTGGIGRLVTAAETQLSAATVTCGQNTANGTRPANWGVAALLGSSGKVYCVDSTGFAGETAATTAGNEITDGYGSGDVDCQDAGDT